MQTDENKTDTLDLETLVLLHGKHAKRERGVCLMEAVAWFAGEPHTDHPKCADLVLTSFGIALNDRWSDAERQKLVPIIPLLVGTRGSSKLSTKRAWFLCDRIVRWHYPRLLRSLPTKPRADIAERLEALSPVVDRESANRARDLAREIRKEFEGAAIPWSAADAADADAAYAYAYAAYAYAYADAAYAYAAAYAAAAAAQKLRDLRPASVDRLVTILRDACAITEG